MQNSNRNTRNVYLEFKLWTFTFRPFLFSAGSVTVTGPKPAVGEGLMI